MSRIGLDTINGGESRTGGLKLWWESGQWDKGSKGKYECGSDGAGAVEWGRTESRQSEKGASAGSGGAVEHKRREGRAGKRTGGEGRGGQVN